MRTMAKLSIPSAIRVFLCMAGFFIALTDGFCECGYSSQVQIGSSVQTYVFTDVIEADFIHVSNITVDTDWVREGYNVTAIAAHGTYGMNFTTDNVVSNPVLDQFNWSGPGIHGGTPGLQLIVDPGIPKNGFIQVSELDSSRVDLLHGSFRTSMKITPIAGTCSATFWYYNDSQEIDIEILSSSFDFVNQIFPVNLVMQSKQSLVPGFTNTVGDGNYLIANLSFDPTAGFHEYRIDFVPGNVIFYADSIPIGSMNSSAIPTSPGHLVLKHWSNGNDGWSQGPPNQTAITTVEYMKAYFNSSDPERQSAATLRCKDPTDPGQICAIPDAPIQSPDPAPFFFSQQPNMTNNQTIYGKSGYNMVISAFSSFFYLSLAFSMIIAVF